MKKIILFVLFYSVARVGTTCPAKGTKDKQKKDITALIDKYSLARENKDTVLLKAILTTDVDQLVSTGEWRNGVQSSVKGMLRSSAATPGTRTLAVEKIRLFLPLALSWTADTKSKTRMARRGRCGVRLLLFLKKEDGRSARSGICRRRDNRRGLWVMSYEL